MITKLNGQCYEFGPFRLDPTEQLLLRQGRPVPLVPKAFDMLLVLVRHSGHLLAKDDLMNEVWPKQFVEEGNLSLNISILRKVLGEQYIETVPKRGYRFVPGVREVSPQKSERCQLDHVRAGSQFGEERDNRLETIDSIAVLPMVNVSADPHTEYLSDGITDGLINSLSQLRQLRVLARSTVFRYKGCEVDAQEVGRQLGVRAVLLGRVLLFGEHLTVRTELVDATDGTHLWGAQYNRDPSDILGAQEEIVRDISEKLHLKLTCEDGRRLTKRYTENTEAYHEYLRGRYFWSRRTEDGLKSALNHFQRAIEIDPLYALAYSGLADCYTLLGSAGYKTMPSSEAMRKARAATAKALEIDGTLAEAHTSLAYTLFRLDWDWTRAESEFVRAIDLNPNYSTAHHWYAVYLSAMGRHEEAVIEIERALKLDPLSLIITSAAGRILHFAGRYDEAINQCRQTLEMDPNYSEAYFNLGLVYEQKGMHEEAIAELQKATELSGNRTPMRAVIGYASAMVGRVDEARSTLRRLKELVIKGHASPVDVALVHTGLGERAEAIKWLQRAFDERSGTLVFLNVEPLYDSLRSDPQFVALVQHVGFATKSRKIGRR